MILNWWYNLSNVIYCKLALGLLKDTSALRWFLNAEYTALSRWLALQKWLTNLSSPFVLCVREYAPTTYKSGSWRLISCLTTDFPCIKKVSR